MNVSMNRRTMVVASGAATGIAMGQLKLSSKKKGFCTVPRRDLEWDKKLRQLKAKWFYTWGSKAPEGIPPGIEFVPMQWSKWGCTAEKLAAIKAAGHHTLLGFNEPDQKSQANISVEKAIELWPLLMDTGLRLGSPAGVHPDGEWMEAFMAEAKKRSCRVDFITVHSYYGKNPKHFLRRMEKIHKLYKKPIWITEFSVADWSANKDQPNKYSPDDVLKFMEAALPALEQMDCVERYAWFSGNKSPIKPSRLFDDEGALTKAGRFYASI